MICDIFHELCRRAFGRRLLVGDEEEEPGKQDHEATHSNGCVPVNTNTNANANTNTTQHNTNANTNSNTNANTNTNCEILERESTNVCSFWVLPHYLI